LKELEKKEIMENLRSYSNKLLTAIDGTEYPSSKKVHCDKCSQQVIKNGVTNYSHYALIGVIVQAGNQHEISLEPEFITPQDGHEKQDCEIDAGKFYSLS
jgi:hypothetical protein